LLAPEEEEEVEAAEEPEAEKVEDGTISKWTLSGNSSAVQVSEVCASVCEGHSTLASMERTSAAPDATSFMEE
jgi:hypothetical protein